MRPPFSSGFWKHISYPVYVAPSLNQIFIIMLLGNCFHLPFFFFFPFFMLWTPFCTHNRNGNLSSYLSIYPPIYLPTYLPIICLYKIDNIYQWHIAIYVLIYSQFCKWRKEETHKTLYKDIFKDCIVEKLNFVWLWRVERGSVDG